MGDIVDGPLRAATTPLADGEAINLASGKETKVMDMANMVNELTENPAGIALRERRNRDHQRRLLGYVTKAGEVLDYEPRARFAEGLEQTVGWFRDNWNQINETTRF